MTCLRPACAERLGWSETRETAICSVLSRQKSTPKTALRRPILWSPGVRPLPPYYPTSGVDQ
jgi:hypothetical protein